MCQKEANIERKRKAISQRKPPCTRWRNEITFLQVMLHV